MRLSFDDTRPLNASVACKMNFQLYFFFRLFKCPLLDCQLTRCNDILSKLPLLLIKGFVQMFESPVESLFAVILSISAENVGRANIIVKLLQQKNNFLIIKKSLSSRSYSRILFSTLLLPGIIGLLQHTLKRKTY